MTEIITLQLPTRVDLEGALCTPGADDSVYPHEARHMLRDLAAQVLDQNARFLTRAHGLIDQALGDGIERLVRTGGLLKLGYQRLGDYVRQELGISTRHAQELAWRVRKLESFPLVAQAVKAGKLLPSKVRLLLRTIEPDDEVEWIDKAMGLSVRRLEDALREKFGDKRKAVPGSDGQDDDESDDTSPKGRWIEGRLNPYQTLKWDIATEIIRRQMGFDLPLAEVVDLMIPEFTQGWGRDIQASRLGRLYTPPYKEPPQPGDPGTPEYKESRRELQRFLEDESSGWYFLPRDVPHVEVAEFVHLPDDLTDPWELSKRLRLVLLLAQRVESFLARVLFTLANHRLWKDMQFTCLGHYITERLHISVRAAQSLIALRRRFYDLPPLEVAFRSGKLTRAQAQAIARVADDLYVDEWIEYARKVAYRELDIVTRARRTWKERDPGDFWRNGRRPPALPEIPPADAKTCAPAGEGAAGGHREQPGAAGEPRTAERELAGAKTCAPAGEGAAAELGEQPGVKPMTRREKAAAEEERIDREIQQMRDSPLRQTVRFFLPTEMEEAWAEVERCGAIVMHDKATTADLLEVLADAVLDEYRDEARRVMKAHPISTRDRWRCVLPTCSDRGCAHEHHVEFRSRGGSDDPSNLTRICAGHHQQGVHEGRIEITGKAPHDLRIRQGIRPDGRAHYEFYDGVIVSGPDAYDPAEFPSA